jgi:predicted DNA binding CopG/RHH family protein
MNRLTRICGEKNRELKKLRVLIRATRRDSRKVSNGTGGNNSNNSSTSTNTSTSISTAEVSPTSKARTLSRLEMDRDEAERGLNAADAEKRLLKQRIENTEQEVTSAREKLLTIERQINARLGTADLGAMTKRGTMSKLDLLLDSSLQEAEAMAALTLKREQSMEAFMRQVAEMRVSVERQVGQYKGLLDNNDLRVETERRRADDLASRLAEAEERCTWLESMLKMPSANELRTSQSEIDFLRTKLAKHQDDAARLAEQSDKLRDDLHSSQDRVALLERMMHIPALRKSTDLAMTKRQRNMTQRLSAVTAHQGQQGGGDDPFDQPLLSTWSAKAGGGGGGGGGLVEEDVLEDALLYASTKFAQAGVSSIPVAAVADDHAEAGAVDYRGADGGWHQTHVAAEQASAETQTYRSDDAAAGDDQGPLSVERLSTKNRRSRTTPVRYSGDRRVYEVASSSPRTSIPVRPKLNSPSRAWAPTSPSASAQDAKHSAALEYGDRGRDASSYTFLLQKKMGSLPASRREGGGGGERAFLSSLRVGSPPQVEVFTSTLHTVFMAFANRTTLTLGKTGFRRFGIECPGLIKSSSRSRKWQQKGLQCCCGFCCRVVISIFTNTSPVPSTSAICCIITRYLYFCYLLYSGPDESVIDEGHLQVIYSRAVPRNGKSRGKELDFASFVDALLWISIVKFPQQDISLAFWRLITEHVFLFAFVPQQVQTLAHTNASTRLAKLVLRQGSGRIDF